MVYIAIIALFLENVNYIYFKMKEKRNFFIIFYKILDSILCNVTDCSFGTF